MLNIVDYGELFDARKNQALALEIADTKNKYGFKRKYDSLLETVQRDGVPGDRYLKSLTYWLDQFEGFTRSESQREFHENFINATLPHVYGVSDFERYRTRILRERGIDSMAYEILICTPRRWGKTTSVAMFIASMLYAVPNTWISCFSTGQRASTLLLDQAAKFFLMLPNAKERIIKKNSEQFFIKGDSASDIRQFFSFPSSVAGLKGVGAKVIILEEASRLNEEVFTEVVIPLLGVSHTSLIGISTPLEESNFYSQLLVAKKPNGANLFKCLNVKLVCDACREKNLVTCGHATQLPSWKSSARADLVQTLMSNNTDMWQREALGVITSKDNSAYDNDSIMRFSDAANSVVLEACTLQDDYLYVVTDPNGGGASQFAIMSGFIDVITKRLVVVSADAAHVNDDKSQEVFLNKHLEKIRANTKFSNCTIVLIIERNFGGSVMASRIANILGFFPPMKIVSADVTSNKRVGVITTELVKERGRSDLQRLFRLDLIRPVKKQEFMSSDIHITDVLVKQLQNFKFVVTEMPSGKQKVKLSGKGYGTNDDLSICLLLLNFWASYVLGNGQSSFI